jgi:hypothetical protein
MGDSVNMAARLMCHAEAKSNVLCDERSFKLCEAEYNFQDLGQAIVKGKEGKPILIFRPMKSKTPGKKGTEGEDSHAMIIGRVQEKMLITKTVEAHLSGAGDKLVIFEGEGGLGLSTMKDFCVKEAVRLGAHIWFVF